jgi:hypothetical protein
MTDLNPEGRVREAAGTGCGATARDTAPAPENRLILTTGWQKAGNEEERADGPCRDATRPPALQLNDKIALATRVSRR